MQGMSCNSSREIIIKIKSFAFICLCFGLIGCASLFAPRQIQDSFVLDKSFDSVWQATLETLAEMEFKLTMPLDKGSSLISTTLMEFPESKKEYWKQSEHWCRGKVTVFVKSQGDNQTVLKVIPKFGIVFVDVPSATTKSWPGFPDVEKELYRRSFVSTGKLEAEVFKRVSEKAK